MIDIIIVSYFFIGILWSIFATTKELRDGYLSHNISEILSCYFANIIVWPYFIPIGFAAWRETS